MPINLAIPGTNTGSEGGTTFSGTVSAFSTTTPPAAPTSETGATSAGGASTTAVSGSPLAVYQSKPTQYGGNTIGRSFDTFDADAISNLDGVVTGHGLYQDITAFIASLMSTYAVPTSQVMQTPRALLVAVRDQINFMLINSPVAS